MINKVVLGFRRSLIIINIISLLLVFKFERENFSSIIVFIRLLICCDFFIKASLYFCILRINKKNYKNVTSCFDISKLSDRQKFCLRNLIYENETYKSLAISLCVSESTIKKDMTDLYEIFNVKSKNELKKELLSMDKNLKKLLLEEKCENNNQITCFSS